MDSTGEQLHPNWRALTTIHLPLKRFVPEGKDATDRGTSDKRGQKYEIQGVDGKEVKEFYEEVIESEKISVDRAKTNLICFKKVHRKNVQWPKQRFEEQKYFRYAMQNNVEELQKLDYKSSNINVCDAYGWTALMMAACEGATQAVEFLLELGVDRRTKDKSSNTALKLASKKGHAKLVEILQGKEIAGKEREECTTVQTLPEPFYCELCQRRFTETTQREHQTSTVHQFNAKPTLPANKLQKFNIPVRNRGLQLMVKQGWNKESGLGPTESGRLYPVKTVIRKRLTGLGIEQAPPRVTHFEAFDLRATKRDNSDYHKKKPRTRNDMHREKQREWKRQRRLRNELS